MVFSRNIWQIVKKKYSVSPKDKKDWMNFTKNIGEISTKETDIFKKSETIINVPKIDLHGNSLEQANKNAKKFIIKYYNLGYKKILLVTGKGSTSKSYNNPYVSESLTILKNSVPEFINNDEDLKKIIIKISDADPQDGGEGAIYIFLRNINKFKE